MSYPATEGFSKCYGVNTHSILPVDAEKFFFLAGAVNRSTYGTYNDTRPPFTEIPTKFQSTEEQEVFENAAISGMKFYEGEGGLFSAFLIVAVGDRIMAGYIRANFIEFFTIYQGIDPQWIFSFFGQALNILTWNNGISSPLYWNGDVLFKMREVYKSPYVLQPEDQRTPGTALKPVPMPVSNLSVFAHGRLHVATQENLVYSSDFLLSQGLDIPAREGVLRFQESQYPSSGDGFGAPAEQGEITAMIVMPRSDQINGHGDLMIGCRNGFFSISPGDKPRNQWTNDPSMQKIVFTGKGVVAHQSMVSWGNQIYYRDSNNEISSLNYDISAYQRQLNFDSISTYVEKYLGYDNNSSDVKQCIGFTTAKRMFMTTAHAREASSLMGTHRYANGMISVCMQKRQDGSALSWEGLWTGPRPVAAVVSNIGGYKKTIVASFDTDKKNRLYYIDETSKKDDFVKGEYRAIESKFSYTGIMFDSVQNSPLVKKSLQKVDILMVDSNPKSLTSTYQSDGTPEAYPIKFKSTTVKGCGLTTVRELSSDICSTKSATSNVNSNEGYFFTVNFTIEGQAQLVKVVFGGSTATTENGFVPLECHTQLTEEVTFCDIAGTKNGYCNNDFSYQF